MESITFEASRLEGNISYIWDFGDGNVTVVRVPTTSHTYTTYGSHRVNLTIVINDTVVSTVSKIVNVTKRGDFFGNYEVDITDVVYVAGMVVGKIKPDIRADFNENSRVDVGDLAKIAYYAIGKISKI